MTAVWQVWDVIVIGGGAAGLWAAGTAAQRGRSTLVLEKNRKAGVKILMSGGTRCNITHDCDVEGIVAAFGPSGKFLYPALKVLGPKDVIRQVEQWGVPTKVESTGKVFPVSDRAMDVRDALVRRLEQSGAELRTGMGVVEVHWQQPWGPFRVITPDATLTTDHLIIASGGMSYPECGTTGDGYAWVQQWSHSLVTRRPALTPLVSSEPWVHALSGLTLPDVGIHVDCHEYGKRLRRDPRLSCRSSLLFTHFGVSGPAAMNVSRAWGSQQGLETVGVRIDLLPDKPPNELEELLRPDSGRGSQRVIQVLRDRVPRRLAESLLSRTHAAIDVPLAELAKSCRMQLIQDLKSLPIRIDGTLGYKKAEVTAGGVDLREVDPRTMKSRRVPGLYLAGEILDLDGPIGGFNFQAAFSTGHVAGLHA